MEKSRHEYIWYLIFQSDYAIFKLKTSISISNWLQVEQILKSFQLLLKIQIETERNKSLASERTLLTKIIFPENFLKWSFFRMLES